MPQSIAESLESQIRNHRLFEFPVSWSNELIFPYYGGLSLANVPQSVAAALGAPFLDSNPLLDSVWQRDVPQAKRVVLFLMDGTGYQHLNRLMDEDSELHDAVLDLNGGRDIVPLTSVTPSTTVVALSSLWTGVSPAQTGMTGTLMFLREVSLLTNMLTFAPMAGRHPQDVLAQWGLAPENIIKAQGLAQHLQEQGIPTYNVTNQMYIGTGLSRILHRGSDHAIGHKGYGDFMGQVEAVLKETQGKQAYVSIYWEAVDALAHKYGANHEYTNNEIREKIFALRDLSFSPGMQDGETLFILLADHGHADATSILDLGKDELINSSMQMSLSGDERHAYMYLRHGKMQAVKDRIESHYADSLTYIETEKAIESEYFGKNPVAELSHRTGDLILLPRSAYSLADPVLGSLPIISRHAGLSEQEMLIPFIWKLS